jgi:hypothetical protein
MRRMGMLEQKQEMRLQQSCFCCNPSNYIFQQWL